MTMSAAQQAETEIGRLTETNSRPTEYQDFLVRKQLVTPAAGLTTATLNAKMFPFQRDITLWALRRGRAAIWADCGLGKSWMAIEWARCVHEHTERPVLILTPLAVARQFVHEGSLLDVDVRLVREQGDVAPGVNVTNYERLHKIDPTAFAGVVADESSILKDYTSATRNALIESFATTPFRLACTATPAPNDQMELGNHAEFLGAMSRTEMLAMFFVHDGGETQKWRLKGHARQEFWRWVASWAVALRRPSDLGYDDAGYDLPPLDIIEHVVPLDVAMARDAGMLFVDEARTLSDQRAARRASIGARVELAASLVNGSSDPWVVWCELNDESAALASAIPDAVEVKGSDDPDEKERRLWAFTRGEARVMVSKPSIAGWGLNWQHCARNIFVGVSHSFEQWYQAIRRTYRFGQSRAVECHLIRSDADGAVVASLRRKQSDAEAMVSGMLAEVSEVNRENLGAPRNPSTDLSVATLGPWPPWLGEEVA